MVRVMKSALSPFVFPFRCLCDDGSTAGQGEAGEAGGEPKTAANDAAAADDAPQVPVVRTVMFKIGDDLRQDQLMMQVPAARPFHSPLSQPARGPGRDSPPPAAACSSSVSWTCN